MPNKTATKKAAPKAKAQEQPKQDKVGPEQDTIARKPKAPEGKDTRSKSEREADALLLKQKVTPGFDKIHPTDTAAEAAEKISEGHQEAQGSAPAIEATARDATQKDVARQLAGDRKDLVDQAAKVAADQGVIDERVEKQAAENERRRLERVGAFDVPVFVTKASCQTCADFLSGYRNDLPCGHDVRGIETASERREAAAAGAR